MKAEPVTGAGFDPAFIPGLTAPAVAEGSANADPESAEPEEVAEAEDTRASVRPEDPAATAEEPEETGDAEEADEVAEDDGPVFEASDRRARIVADRGGVRLSLDEESCEFGWDEIAAVETETPRFGKRYTVTVHTAERRWYPIEIEATTKARFKEWDEQLDAVLDAYFEEGE